MFIQITDRYPVGYRTACDNICAEANGEFWNTMRA